MSRVSQALAALGLACVTVSAGAGELSPQDFAFGASIESATSGTAYRFELPTEVYVRTAYEDLRDLRIFNARGEVVPYELQQAKPVPSASPQGHALSLYPLRGQAQATLNGLQVTIRTDRGAVSVDDRSTSDRSAIVSYVIDARTLSTSLSALELHWQPDAPDFSGSVRVDASDDLQRWHTLTADAPVVNLHASDAQLVQSRLEFTPTKAKFLRLTWNGAPAPFGLSSVTAVETGSGPVVAQSSISVPGTAVSERPNELAFDLGGRFPLTQVNLELPEANTALRAELLSRPGPSASWRPVAAGEFYRVRGATNADRTNPPIAIATNHDRFWLLRLKASDVGIRNARLSGNWNATDVVFLARGPAPYSLAYGNASISNGSVALDSLLTGVTVTPATLGKAVTLGGPARLLPAPRTLPSRMALLWVLLGCGALFLMWMTLRLARELKSARPEN